MGGHRCDRLSHRQTLQKELAGHTPRLVEVLSRGEVAASGDELSPELEARVRELRGLWETLQAEAAARHRRLQEAGEAQQYYLDAGEAEAWVSEQELFMGAEEKPKVRGGSPRVLRGALCHAVLCHAGSSYVNPGRAMLCC